jgi:vancomycin resistance protein YoaR
MNNKKIKNITIMAFAILSLTTLLGFSFYNTREEMKNKIELDYIHNNIFINDINVGGLTKVEAKQKLYETIGNDLRKKEIILKDEEVDFTLTFGDFNATQNYDEAIEIAYNYGRKGSVVGRYRTVRDLLEQPKMISYEPQITVDYSLIPQKIEEFKNNVWVSPVNAKMSRDNGQFYFVEGQQGKKLDIEKMQSEIKEKLLNGTSGVVEASFIPIEPDFNAESLKNSTDLLASYRSPYTSGTAPRNINIANASSKINGVVVYPGEIFSINYHFGEMSTRNGYAYAPVIVRGQFVDGIGGGICQVSTAMYNAVKLAELEVVERRNHSMKVGYAAGGFDAAVAGDFIDFKFKNNTDYPVYIESFVTNTHVVVNIYGNEMRPANRSIRFENSLIETIEPEPEKITENQLAQEGYREVVVRARNGYRYNVYKIVTVDGVDIERALFSTSFYRPVMGEVIVGSRRAETVDSATTKPFIPIPEPIEIEYYDVLEEIPTDYEQNNIYMYDFIYQ